jgi:SAM-dependent methyltransferase
MSRQPSASCKLCGSPAPRVGWTHNRSSATEVLHAHRCSECGLVFVANALDSAELAEAYSRIDADAYYDEIKATNALKFGDTLRDLSALTSRSADILDIGTGDGAFVHMLLDAGYTSVAAHEVPGMDLSALEARGVRTYHDFDYSSIPTASFDVVTLLDVAEHVPDPLQLFSACSRVLRPGGIVYFHAPVVTRTDLLMHRLQRYRGLDRIGRAWQTGRTSVYHLQNYTPRAIRLLFSATGFEPLFVRTENELSWPVSSYIRIYLCERYGLPSFVAPLLTPFAWPFLATDLLNPNKGIACARKPALPHGPVG